jgi:hypothetical protein
LGGAFISRPRLRCNTCMQVHFEIIHRWSKPYVKNQP